MFKLKFSIANEAFDDGCEGRLECARILRKIATTLEANSYESGKCMDANGNSVGKWELTTS
jgi:hypothetical protein